MDTRDLIVNGGFELPLRPSGVVEEHLVYVQVQFYDVTLAQLGREWAPVAGTAAGGADWRRLTVPFQVPEGTAVIDVRMGITAPNNAGSAVWFDDISVLPVGG